MKKYLSIIACLLLGITFFTACDDDNDGPVNPNPTNVADGVFIINEGSYYASINGTLDYLDYATGSVSRNIFETVNRRSLGGTPNNGVINDSTLYIACTDENKVEMINTRTMRSIGSIDVDAPRELATDGNTVFVTSYTGRVSAISTVTRSLVLTSDSVGNQLEGIVSLGDFVFVANSYELKTQGGSDVYDYKTQVNVLSKYDLNIVRTYTVEKNPTQMVTDGRYVYVVCMGDYATVTPCVERIDAANQTVTKLFDATMIAYDGSMSLYYVNYPYGSTPTYGWYDISTGTNTKLNLTDAPQFPYSIGVDPVSGDFFVAAQSPNPDAPQYASYTADGYLVRYDKRMNKVAQYTIGLNPGTLVFNSHRARNNR